MKKCLHSGIIPLCLILLWSISNVPAQSALSNRIMAIGNTADLPLEDTFYKNLRSTISSATTPTAVIINGDFTDGHMNLLVDSIRIARLTSIVRGLDHASLIVLPGDRDWGKWPIYKYLFPIPLLSGLLPSFHSNFGTGFCPGWPIGSGPKQALPTLAMNTKVSGA